MISLNPKYQKYNPYYDLAKHYSLARLAVNYLPEILDALGVKYKDAGRYLCGPCPVHDGDNAHAFNIFRDGHTTAGNWTCYTRGCHEDGNSLFDLVKQIKQCNIKVAIDFVCRVIGVTYDQIKADQEFAEREMFCRAVDSLVPPPQADKGIHRNELASKLNIPATYYLNRGYSAGILRKYCVGECLAENRPMSGRVVVPVFDDNGEYMIGCIGRSLYEKCDKCQSYHPPGTCYNFQKWLNQSHFEASSTLYNYWEAKKAAKATGTMVLVEGAGDVWRLVENGIENVVGLYGAKLSDQQLIILEKSGIFNLVVLTDEDEAGRKAAERIKKKCGRIFRMYFPRLSTKDAGELNADKIDSDVKPILERLANAEKALCHN